MIKIHKLFWIKIVLCSQIFTTRIALKNSHKWIKMIFSLFEFCIICTSFWHMKSLKYTSYFQWCLLLVYIIIVVFSNFHDTNTVEILTQMHYIDIEFIRVQCHFRLISTHKIIKIHKIILNDVTYSFISNLYDTNNVEILT
jgi:hypothetical protein